MYFGIQFCSPGQNKTQKICDKIAYKEPFMLKYRSDRSKTQKMCEKAVDACLTALKFAPHWLVTTKMLEILSDVSPNDDLDLII